MRSLLRHTPLEASDLVPVLARLILHSTDSCSSTGKQMLCCSHVRDWLPVCRLSRLVVPDLLLRDMVCLASKCVALEAASASLKRAAQTLLP